MNRRTMIGILVVFLVLVPVGSLGQSYVNEQHSTQPDFADIGREAQQPMAEQTPVVEPRDNITVISYQYGQLVAFAPNGTVYYYDNSSFDQAFDVDPVPGTENTVLHVGNRQLDAKECESDRNCVRNIVRQTNLTTGKSTVLYSKEFSERREVKWHDVDREEDRLLIADITHDKAFVINLSTGRKTWEWRFSEAYNHSSGGPYPKDWTHLNDIELLDDGRIMLSPRNMDEVVFIKPGHGLQEQWTLGEDDKHTVLYEQHNPDYIPEKEGGPAVVVGDSQNNRVIEYQWTGSEWRQSWVWTDDRMQWPRDADRLPNGHTLITDTQAPRVLEVNAQGEIVWKVTLPAAYDAERLGTGDESSGGPSAKHAGLSSHGELRDSIHMVKMLVPSKLLNAILFVAPPWISPVDVLLTAGSTLSLLGIGVFSVVRRRTDVIF